MPDEPTPLPDAIHLGNTDIEVENWQPPESVERAPLPGREHLLNYEPPAPLEVLGYRTNSTPIYETPRGALTTRALVLCTKCHITIKTTGGPMFGSLCVECFKGHRPAP